MTLQELLKEIYFNYDVYLKLCKYYLANATAPTADFSADATTVVINTDVTFTNASTGEAPLSYAWSFGDGRVSSSENPVIQYLEPGVYTVTLVCEDAVGVQASEVKISYITVTAV